MFGGLWRGGAAEQAQAEPAQAGELESRRTEVVLLTWAYIFISSSQPKKAVRAIRKVRGVVHADALFGSPDVIAIVTGRDIAAMDAVIDRIADLPVVGGTDSKVARWIDGVTLPFAQSPAGQARQRNGRGRSERSRRTRG